MTYSSVNALKAHRLTMKRPVVNFYVLAALLALITLAGGALALGFTSVQDGRELMQWQNKLNLIADSRAADINGWVDRHFRELGAVANNPSLQLYMTELQAASDKTPPAEEPAQLVYLRNLLLITADRLAFIEKAPDELNAINANVRSISGTGLAIIDNNGKLVVSTAGMASIEEEVAKKIAEAPMGKTTLIDAFKAESGATEVGFVIPVFAIQGEQTAAQQIGKLVGIKKIDENFFKLLIHPGVTDKTLEAALLRKEGDSVVYLSPRAEAPSFSLKFSLDTPDLDAAFAITTPKEFSVRHDIEAKPTLMTSRAIVGAPWVLLLHISREEAMAESDAWVRHIEYMMLSALVAVLSVLLAVWYYGTSRKSMLLSIEATRLADRLSSEEKLLRVVTDNQLEPIFIVDKSNIVQFVNERGAHTLRLLPADVMGRDLPAVLGSARAAEYIEANQRALASGKPFIRTWRMELETGVRVMQSAHVPLEQMPDDTDTKTQGVLIIDQDVTDVVMAREHRLSILQQLVNALVKMVDKRDHHAANHSAAVALVARRMAEGLGLDDTMVETAETAGKLMNLGKIVVPSEILTRASPLADDEIKFVREALKQSVDLLQDITFDGPVVDTLRQVQERFDGSGPLRLSGEHILMPARIIAAANAFVGMVSSRSYHATMSVKQALQILLQDDDTQFDHRVVVALAHFIENDNGEAAVVQLVSRPAE